MERFLGGLIFKAQRLLYHSSLGSKIIKKKKKITSPLCRSATEALPGPYFGAGAAAVTMAPCTPCTSFFYFHMKERSVEVKLLFLFFITLEPRVESYDNL